MPAPVPVRAELQLICFSAERSGNPRSYPVQSGPRCSTHHNPVLREAALDQDRVPIAWLGNWPVKFAFA